MTNKDNKTAILYMVAASLLFAGMNLLVKYLDNIPVAQLVFMRSLVMLVMVVVMLRSQRIEPFGTQKHILFWRGVFGTLGITCFFYTVKQMPLASALVVHYLTPIITVLISVLITRIPVAPLRWFFFMLCFIGIYIIKDFDERVQTIPMLVGVLGTVMAASAYNIISKLKNTEHYFVIMLYFPMVTVPASLLYIVITGDWVWPDAMGWVWLTCVGLFTYYAQYFQTRAYQIGEISKVSIISYLGIIYALAAGYWLFNEWYSTVVIAGILLVMLGVVGNILYKGKVR